MKLRFARHHVEQAAPEAVLGLDFLFRAEAALVAQLAASLQFELRHRHGSSRIGF